MKRPVIIDRSRDEDFMREALALAAEGAQLGEVPVGAVVVQNGQVIGRGFNCPISRHDPSAHAEMVAIRDAAANIANYRLSGSTLYVTLEPCSMCAGLIVHSRIQRVVYGATEPKAGVAISRGQFFSQAFLNHRVVVEGGVMPDACSAMLSEFFRARRLKAREGGALGQVEG
ncbi:tRNA adenosine(34) deaminase TadA [Pseudomonas sp. KSR10]|jgi:tRNA(adenine34) deaminase|uniref:tRNA-specific adenosine deaminase n=1 Tax=Stutzerimonas stutzeri TaxID=316 RepID=A0A0D9AHE2_STUST|nr:MULTISPECIES: tRNA adenosine(34) deaminase TadA [Pseudomonadaceae]KJH80465.1 zinc-binding protein [Stutzerimonas stutzeri]MCG6541992.1 tRNA adenosine(34) deaminase TadA [Pseudomonas sp. KSR10]